MCADQDASSCAKVLNGVSTTTTVVEAHASAGMDSHEMDSHEDADTKLTSIRPSVSNRSLSTDEKKCSLNCMIQLKLMKPGLEVLRVERNGKYLYGDLLWDGTIRYSNNNNPPKQNKIFTSPTSFCSFSIPLLDPKFKRGNGFTYVFHTVDGMSWQSLDYYRSQYYVLETERGSAHSKHSSHKALTSTTDVPRPAKSEQQHCCNSVGGGGGRKLAGGKRARGASDAAGSLKRFRCAENVQGSGRQKTNSGGGLGNRVASAAAGLLRLKDIGNGNERAQGQYLPGDLVEALFMGRKKTWYPADVIGPPPKGYLSMAKSAGEVKVGSDGDMYLVRYHHKPLGNRVVPASDMRLCHDFEWCDSAGDLDELCIGDAVAGRYRHAEGNKEWYPGRVMQVRSDGTYNIKYDDGDYEKYVRRENIRMNDVRGLDHPEDGSSNGGRRKKRIAHVKVCVVFFLCLS